MSTPAPLPTTANAWLVWLIRLAFAAVGGVAGYLIHK